MVAIIDYGAGNLRSVEQAVEFLGGKAVRTRDEQSILSADHVILPGVGAFGSAMEKLEQYELVPVIKEVVRQQIPLLGICLGLQLFFEESEESPDVPGLGILEGRVIRIPDAPGLKVPQIGWNALHLQNSGRLFEGIPEKTCVYFVHSYYLQAKDEQIVKAVTDYGVRIHASTEQGNVFACQFHPEKSGQWGLKILENFLKI